MKHRRKTYGRLAVIIWILLMSASLGYAQIPEMINYQGYLADTEGAVTGTVKMEFKIYGAAGVLWSEIHESVVVNNGIYNVRLGSVNSLGGLPFNEPYFLGITVGDDSEMTPRQPLTSVGYAFTANTALNVPNNLITSMMIQDGTISTEDVNFNYAGSASKGGPAMGLACTGCVSQTELDFTPLMTELDPQVGDLSAGKWCMSDGDVINCLEDAPSASSWNLTGNAGTSPGANFLGTIDNEPFEIRVANKRALRIERHSGDPDLSPNIIEGDLSNGILPNVIGSTIGGGGEPLSENVITDNFGTIGGGKGNMAGNDDVEYTNASHATVGGGRQNKAQGMYATIGGGWGNQVLAKYGTIGGGGETIPDDPSTANRVTDNYGTIGGGGNNQAGDDEGTTEYASFATVGGGSYNIANGLQSTVSGGAGNTAGFTYATVGGGSSNEALSWAGTVSGGAGNTAGGAASTVSGGDGNSANTARATIGGGQGNEATGDGSTIPGGMFATASHYGQMAYASGNFDAYYPVPGDAQTSLYVLRRMTSNSTQTELFLDEGIGLGGPHRITIEPNRTMTFDILVVGMNSAGISVGYHMVGLIKNVAGSVQMIGTPKKDGFPQTTLWDAEPEADDTNDALVIKVTGDDSLIRWVATVRTAEVAWPAP